MTSSIALSPSAVVRAGLETLLRSLPFVSSVTGIGALEALDVALTSLDPELVIVDVVGGFQDTIERLDGVPAVVLLTDEVDGTWVESMLGRGAWAVLSRDAPTKEISGAVRAVTSGLVAFDLQHARALTVAPVLNMSREVPGLEALTAREREVLDLLAEGIGNKMIARRLSISEHTVKYHVASILSKLDAESRTEAVTTGVRQGLITV